MSEDEEFFPPARKRVDKVIGDKIDKFAREETEKLAGIFIPDRIDAIEPFAFRLSQILEKFYREIIADSAKRSPNRF